MQCPHCHGETTVYLSREDASIRLRYRVCLGCGHRFTTAEEYLRDVKPQKKTVAKLKPANTNQVDWVNDGR